MTITWESPVTEVVWESQTAPGITWTTVVGGTGGTEIPARRLLPNTVGTPGQTVVVNEAGTAVEYVDDTGDGAALSDDDPAALGVADPGTSDDASRSDHVHPMPTAADVGALSLATLTSFARTLLDDADAATARTTLGIRGIGKVRPKGNSLTHLGLPNVDFYGGRDTTVLADTLFYGAPFFVDEDIAPDLISLRVTSAPGSSANARCAVVEVDNDLQPSASALFDQQIVIGTGTGVFTSALTGVTLVPGKVYVPIIQSSVNVNMRSYYALRTFIDTTMPASYINQYRKSRTYAAFSGTPPAWNTISNVNGLVGIDTFFLLRW